MKFIIYHEGATGEPRATKATLCASVHTSITEWMEGNELMQSNPDCSIWLRDIDAVEAFAAAVNSVLQMARQKRERDVVASMQAQAAE